MNHNQPIFAFSIGLVSRFSQDPHQSHSKPAKHILRYIEGIARFGIQYTVGTSELVGFTNFDWFRLVDDKKSTSSFVYHFGSSPIAWSYKKQSSIALSSVEVEYHVAVLASQVVLWL